MNKETLEQEWQDVCKQVLSNPHVNPAEINAFLLRLQPQAMSDGFLVLTTDGAWVKQRVEERYIGAIKQALEDIYNTPFTVSLEIDTSESSQTTPAESPNSSAPVITTQTSSQNPGIQSAPNTAAAPTITPKISFNNSTAENTSIENAPLNNSVSSNPTATFTFENFVIGDSNRMAYSMAVAVAETPGKARLNPLFIYGKSGLGKTHLMRAIQNYINETMPQLTTIYVDSAELLSEYTEASIAHNKEKESFKNFKTSYEQADVLLIDDVQYLQGKKETLDMVFQIFNKLIDQGRQVVLSADRAPKNIDIDERYKSRFNSGGTIDIQPPEIETKLGIIKIFIEEYRETEGNSSFNISDDIQIYIAENSSSNIRELKSAVTKIIYQMTFFNQSNITLDEVQTLLENHFSGGPSKRLTIADIQKEIESFYKISHADLVGQKRTRNIIYARQISMYLCRQMLDLPFNDIGKKFNRDHSTVMYSVTNIEEKMKENRELREELETLRQLIREA